MRSALILFFLASFSASAQETSCSNSDLEDGSFSGWTGTTGWCCPITSNATGIIDGRHSIMTGTDMDPNTDSLVTVVAPGGTYSARLGNMQAGAESEQLKYSMMVDQSNSLFIYRYAVMLEDPNHASSEQPRFEVRIYGENGDVDSCSTLFVHASPNNEGFLFTTGYWGDTIQFRDWTTVGVDLSSHMGENVTIEFSTGDCYQGGHFGYAYIDAKCSELSIGSDLGPEQGSVVLSAPEGFTYGWNTGDTTRSITVADPVPGDQYQCTITSINGCTSALQITLDMTVNTGIEGESEEIKLFPNPADDRVLLSGCNVGDEVTLYNVMGEIVGSGFITQPDAHVIDLAVPNGTYFIRIKSDQALLKLMPLVKM